MSHKTAKPQAPSANMQNVQSVSILGAGWLGKPLAINLLGKGFQVNVSTTQPINLPNTTDGIQQFQIKLSPNIEARHLDKFIDTQVLIVSIPPRVSKYGSDYHVQQIESIIKEIGQKSELKIIYLSSSSVYPSLNQTASEINVVDDNSVLIKAENLLKSAFQYCTILRLAGLMGYDRFPAKYYSNKIVPQGQHPVNYIHRDDAIAIITKIIEENVWGKTYNLVAPSHPTRFQVITSNCQQMGLELPQFAEDNPNEPYKIISGQRLANELHYQFIHSNILDFWK